MYKTVDPKERLNEVEKHDESCQCELCLYRNLLTELAKKGQNPEANTLRLNEIKTELLVLNPNRETRIYHAFVDIAVNLRFAYDYDVFDTLHQVLKRNNMAFSGTAVKTGKDDVVVSCDVHLCNYDEKLNESLYENICGAINVGIFEYEDDYVIPASIQAAFNALSNHYDNGGKEQAIVVRDKILADISKAGYIANTAQVFVTELDAIIAGNN